MRTAITAALGMVMAILAGCQSPDVGQPCTIPSATNSSVDYLQFGPNSECDTQICLRSPLPAGSKIASNLSGCQPDGTNCGYCTKPCVSDADCFQDTTGLECRSVVLDPTFINSLKPDVRDKYFPNGTASDYCAAPLPSP